MIEERVPIWTALSELYLDTELEERDIRRIAGVLCEAPFSKHQLEDILRDEVAPAFAFNLRSVAGDWEPWSEQDVRAMVERSIVRRSGAGWLACLRRRFRSRALPAEWHRIAALLP